MSTLGYDTLGASVVKGEGKSIGAVEGAVLLFGGTLLGTGVGAIFGRAFLGGVLGFVAGLAGCTADNPFFMPDSGGGQAGPDAGTAPDLLLPPQADMSEQPDLVWTPDMTQYLDMSRPQCVESLAGVGTGDFTVRFRVRTQAKVGSTLVYQRNTCNGSVDYWDLRMVQSGSILLNLHQAGPNASTAGFITKNTVNDGAWHEVVLQRRAGVVTLTVDGVEGGSTVAPQSIGALPPVGIAGGHPCEGIDGTNQLDGEIAGTCITIP